MPGYYQPVPRDKSQFSHRRDSHVSATALPNRLDRLALSYGCVRLHLDEICLRVEYGKFRHGFYFPVGEDRSLMGPVHEKKKIVQLSSIQPLERKVRCL